MTLISNAFTPSVWAPALGTVTVFPEPPEKLSQNGLAFFLYHAQENAAFKNFPAPGADKPPVAYTPLALNLYYQMTAHYFRPQVMGALDEQLMMGIAMKALHDSPFLILPDGPDGSSNRIRISLQPIPYNEAAHYWTAGTQPIKFAAYYEITVVLLQPKQTQTMAGRVLSYGNYVFPDGMPRITGTSNVVSFTLPKTTTVQDLTIEPAQVAPGSKMTISGSSWGGDSLGLQFYSDSWTGALPADASWSVTSVALNQLTVTIPQSVNVPLVGPVNVLAGTYRVQVVVTRSIVLSNGQTRTMTTLSNQFPFTVAPLVAPIAPVAAGPVTVNGFFLGLAPPVPPVPQPAVDVFLGSQHLATTGTAPTYTMTGQNQMQITLPAGAVSGDIFPLRVMINGAESAPAWIVLT
jgi:hypothetical protein